MASQILSALTIFLAGLTLAAGVCMNGWMRYEQSCYLYVDSQKEPWSVAMTYCESLDAHLVTVDNKLENDFLIMQLHRLHPHGADQFWTAGTDYDVEGRWVWATTNTTFEQTFWYPGEPNQNGGEEDCLAFYPGERYQWNDEHCDKREYYICETEDPIEGPSPIIG